MEEVWTIHFDQYGKNVHCSFFITHRMVNRTTRKMCPFIYWIQTIRFNNNNFINIFNQDIRYTLYAFIVNSIQCSCNCIYNTEYINILNSNSFVSHQKFHSNGALRTRHIAHIIHSNAHLHFTYEIMVFSLYIWEYVSIVIAIFFKITHLSHDSH